jgi:hypothetical protein
MSSIDQLYCHFCDYTAKNNSNWFKHLATEKHKRKGLRKETFCQKCTYTSTSHWNIKIHNLYIHSTIDERKQSKYYCEDCDNIFLCSAYYNKHMIGIVHLNKVRVKQSLVELNKNIISKQHNVII